MNQPTKSRRAPGLLGLAALSLLLSGCGSSNVEVIDLNRVLEIFDKVATSEVPEDFATGQTGLEQDAEARVVAVDDTDPTRRKAFLDAFAKALNDAKLISTHIGVEMHSDGSIRGFADRNKNGKRDSNEKELFKIEIDPENGRIVATQSVSGQTYRRDHHYSRHHYHNRWGYWMYGSMWGRQRRYYGSGTGRTRPDYSRTTMSSRSYHSSAVSRARSSSSSARSWGGSRSFSGGK